MRALEIPAQACDGHEWVVLARIPENPSASLVWLPALGVAAKHYLPFAEALAGRGVAVFLHEWRGNGSSNQRAGRERDWGYRELLTVDLPASEAAVAALMTDVDRILGGHSLGGQLACCRLGLAPESARHLWLVAGGAPYWRAFPAPSRYWLPLAYRLLPWLADRWGFLPGRHVGFGGAEARGVIRDWARSALTGRYAGAGIDTDLDAAMGRTDIDIRAVVMQHDWMAPESSLRFLLSKLPQARSRVEMLDDTTLGIRADHFAWMKFPDPVVDRLID